MVQFYTEPGLPGRQNNIMAATKKNSFWEMIMAKKKKGKAGSSDKPSSKAPKKKPSKK
jgi:hypothetical protein